MPRHVAALPQDVTPSIDAFFHDGFHWKQTPTRLPYSSYSMFTDTETERVVELVRLFYIQAVLFV